MNKVYKLLLAGVVFLQFSSLVHAQHVGADSSPIYHNERFNNTKGIVQIKADAFFASNTLDQDLIYENFWSKEVIKNQVEGFKNTNFGGLEIEGSFRYIGYDKQLFGKNNLKPWFGVKRQFIGGAGFNSDLAKLILEGNSANQSVSFDKGINGVEFYNSSQIELGLKSIQQGKEISFAIGLIAGHQFSYNKIFAGEIVTDVDGESITANNLHFEFWGSDNSTLNGLGLATSLFYREKTKAGGYFQLGFEDFGFIHWPSVTKYSPKNNAIDYEGFNLTGFWQNDFSASLEDSLSDNYIVKEEISNLRFTPFKVEVSALLPINSESFINANLSYRYFTGYFPRLTATYGKYFNPTGDNRWAAGIDLGGFGLLGLHLGADLALSKHAGLSLKVSGAEGMVSSSLPIFWSAQAGLYFGF